MPVFAGTAAADRIIGSAEADQIYGLDGNDLLYGMDGADWLVGGLGNDTLVGGLGDDSYDVDATGDLVVERAGEGIDYVRASISYQLGANVENLGLTGTADLVGYGNALDNSITGNAGNNVLNGGAGNDILAGGLGNDVYDVDSTGDKVFERADEGYDRVRASVSFALSANIEELNLGGTADINGFGNALANTIIGNAGANVLNGGAGDDILIGRGGNDTYDVDSAGDQVQEAANEGHDRVRASVSYTLGANVEDLTLGSTANIDGTGNALDNTIVGNAGANVLTGGAGSDIMIGRGGNDTYDVDSSGDRVVEAVGEGHDLVRSSIGYALSANVEDLTLVGTAAIGGIGNDLANTIIGNAGANVLYGGDGNDQLIGGLGDDQLVGDSGNDRMVGGVGNDIYDVESFYDQVVELPGEGIDRVYAWTNYSLTANVEILYLKEGIAINGTGNDLDNSVFGNSLINILSGGNGNDVLSGADGNDQLIGGSGNDVLNGGAGFDKMIGGVGNDTYDYDNTLDNIVERPGEGIDQVRTSTTCFLPDNVENLILTGSSSAQGSGNALDNVIMGNSGDNYLEGGVAGNDALYGGDGNDTLYGGPGKDVMEGGAGDDFILVGAGDYVAGERLDGGDGIDRIEFRPSDPSAVLDSASVPFTNIEDITYFGAKFLVDVAFINGLVGINGTVQIKDGGTVDVSGFRHIASTFDLSGAGNHLIMSGQIGDVIVLGGSGADSVDGALGNDTLYGNGGADTLNGADGNDQLWGGDGADTLSGGEGSDLLMGGEGVDTVTGGADRDTFFVWHEMSGDTVTDFTSGTDSFALSSDDISGTFSYIGAAMFSGAGSAQARFQGGQVFVDFDGNGTADVSFFTSNITSATQLHTTDFSVWG
jgi:Ca2+-binding RTX toxin-like protein